VAHEFEAPAALIFVQTVNATIANIDPECPTAVAKQLLTGSQGNVVVPHSAVRIDVTAPAVVAKFKDAKKKNSKEPQGKYTPMRILEVIYLIV
jgi:hypothetical protein